ncbi:putative small intestine urate exporter, partial [Galemys pyrenaicus]
APVYDWTPEIQGIILSSINYGSILAPIPVGYVAGIFGSKYMAGAGLLISSVLTLFSPLAADAGVTLLIVLRVVQGIAQVMVSTSQYSIWAKWAPPLERSQLITIAQSGGIGCAFSFLWFPLIYDEPRNHPFISIGEKEYIITSLVQQAHSRSWSVPIKAMVKSLPLWAILVSSFCVYWRYHIIMSYTPMYINTVLQANFKTSGILSALPFVFSFPSIILGGQLAGFLLSRKILRLVMIRKLFTTTGVLIPVGLLLCLPWVRSSHSTSVALLVLTCVFGSFCEAGVLINIMDIAPRYSAFLKGLSQAASFLAGAIAPTISGYLMNQ